MGHHRADRRGLGRRPSDSTPCAGKRSPTSPRRRSRRLADAGRAGRRRPGPSDPQPAPAAAASPAAEPTSQAPAARLPRSAQRGPLFRGLPVARRSLLGIAALAVSAGGAVTAADPDAASADAPTTGSSARPAPSAAPAASPAATCSTGRGAAVSRDSRRDALADAADADLVAEAEAQAKQRNAALAKFAQQAEAQAAKIALNLWVLPAQPATASPPGSASTACGRSYHTGLDFAAPSGTPIMAVANGVVTSVGYDGSYGNKTVVTLEDGTEIWYCHQSALRRQRRRRGPRRRGDRHRRLHRQHHRLRTCTSRSAPAAATRSTPTPRSSSTASRRS